MTIIELHPDDLLDRELRGQLADDERVRLAEHLANCSTCRLERMMRSDFAAAAEPLRVSQGFASFVTAAMSQAQAETQHAEVRADVQAAGGPGAEAERPVALAPRGSRRRGGLAALLLVAAVLGITVAAAARTEWAERAVRAALGERVASAVLPRSAKRVRAAKSATQARVPVAVPDTRETAHDTNLGLVAAESTPAAAESSPTPGAQLTAGNVVAAQAQATRARRAPAVLDASPALTLFNRATRLRRADDVDGAVATYRELNTRFPRSPEAHRAPVLLGRLLLDVGRLQPALDAFDSYLAAREPALREDALAGRARALSRLGQTPAAQRAYAQLLREFPRSSYAAWMERQRD